MNRAANIAKHGVSFEEARRIFERFTLNFPDDQIDTSDIPPLTEEFFARARLVPPRIKPNVSLRVPADVVEFFKAENPKG